MKKHGFNRVTMKRKMAKLTVAIATAAIMGSSFTAYADNGFPDIQLTSGLTIADAVEIYEAPPINDLTSSIDIADEIYVPDSEDDCPVSDAVSLSVEVQEYIWKKCKQTTDDYKNYYAFILGVIQRESEFSRTAIHHNDNGTTDRGLMQINSCNIKSCKKAGLITCTDDLWDIYKNIDCGFHEMDEYIRKFGVCESAYYAYNTGSTKGGSNNNSRIVMGFYENWKKVLYG